VFAIPLPGQNKLAKPRRQQWSSRLTPVAAGLHKGEAMALIGEGPNLHFWQCPGCLNWDTFPAQRIEEL